MLTQDKLTEVLIADIKDIYTPPPIDDLEPSYRRRMSLEFQRDSNQRRFGVKGLVEQPSHYEEYTDEDGEEREMHVYDDWDEEEWVERGKKELVSEYAEMLYNAQYHLKLLESKANE